MLGKNYLSSLTLYSLSSRFHRMNYGQRLIFAREHAGLTQVELEKRSGVKQNTISKIERGDQNSSTFDVKLAKATGVSPIWLTLGEGEPFDMILDDAERAIIDAYRKGSQLKIKAMNSKAEEIHSKKSP